jgi:hypothetical protein
MSTLWDIFVAGFCLDLTLQRMDFSSDAILYASGPETEPAELWVLLSTGRGGACWPIGPVPSHRGFLLLSNRMQARWNALPPSERRRLQQESMAHRQVASVSADIERAGIRIPNPLRPCTGCGLSHPHSEAHTTMRGGN